MISLALLTVAPRVALVVTIDAYGFSPQAVAPERRLCAATNDEAAIRGVLDLAGFSTRTLSEGAATRAAIVRELDALATRAEAGSDVVLYFSGCGGNSGDARREPTLVPADGKKDDRTLDLPMALVEGMAKRVTAKGARITVILDASFVPPVFRARPFETSAYKPIAKCVVRPGSVRPDLFRGPGAFLCPAWSNGAAYEWRDSASPTSWTSAFTDLLTENACVAGLKGRFPPVGALMREIEEYFKARVGESYMPGLHAVGPKGAADGAPFLVAGPLPLPGSPTVAQTARRRVTDVAARARALRIAVDVALDVPPAREAAVRRRIGDLREELAGVDADLKVVSEYERPDRLVTLSDLGGLTATVEGGDLTKVEHPVYSGATPRAVVVAGLGTYLEKELMAKRLWSLSTGSGRLSWKPRMVRDTIGPGQHIEMAFEAPKPGYLVLLGRDDADGQVKLMAPYCYEPDLHFAAGAQTAPKTLGNQPGQSSPGDSVMVAIFVPAAAGSLPPLPAFRKGVDFEAQERAFAEPLVTHLKALLVRLEKPGAEYGVARLEYRIP